MTAHDGLADNDALDGIAIAPPNPGGEEGAAAYESSSESAEGAAADAGNCDIEGGMTGAEDHHAHHPDQQAAQDRSLRQRLRDAPEDDDAKVDVGSDESMDASDPIAATAPGGNDPVPSSGFPEGQ